MVRAQLLGDHNCRRWALAVYRVKNGGAYPRHHRDVERYGSTRFHDQTTRATFRGGSPLHLAVSNASDDDARYTTLPLLAFKHQLPLTFKHQLPPLLRYKILRVMLEDQLTNEDGDSSMTLFDPNAVDGELMTVLHHACKIGDEKAVEEIMPYCFHYERRCAKQAR